MERNMKMSRQLAVKHKTHAGAINIALFVVLVILILLCMCVGKYSLTPGECLQIIFGKITGADPSWEPMDENLLLGVRLPRVMATVVVGAALALSGAVYQGIFKNPLVSPDFLGVSSGACIGAAVAILLSLSSAMVQVCAFVGGIVAVSLTVMIPKAMRSSSNIMLVLAGIIVSGAMSSILGFIKYIDVDACKKFSVRSWGYPLILAVFRRIYGGKCDA